MMFMMSWMNVNDFRTGHIRLLEFLLIAASSSQQLEEVTVPNREIVRHITPHKTTVCHFYTSIFVNVKDMRQKMLI